MTEVIETIRPGMKIHFVGIGGSGMSGLARLAQARGAVCTGSDHAESPTTRMLEGAGIRVVLQQSAESVPADAELVVASAAIKFDHPERVEAECRGVDVVKYAQMLGRVMRPCTGVAVAGTHGKSTTTSLLAHTLVQAGLDPSVIVGAHCPQIGGGWRLGQSDLLLAEACEYDRSFHALAPTHATILNVEADHLDIYDGIDEIVDSFHTFAQLLPKHGSLLIHHGSPHRMDLTAGLACAVQTIGYEPQADYVVQTIGGKRVRLMHCGAVVCEWASPMPGEHMAYNAAVAAVTAHRLGAAWDAIGPAIEGFQGLDRRVQLLGERDGVTVVDDYGHHPTEIDTTLRALRQHHKPAKLFCVFQPHQHSRTRFLMQQFAASFSAADRVIVPEIYFVRDSEADRRAVTAQHLVDALNAKGVDAAHVTPFEAIVDELRASAGPGDLVVTMGAGDVWRVGRGFVEG